MQVCLGTCISDHFSVEGSLVHGQKVYLDSGSPRCMHSLTPSSVRDMTPTPVTYTR